MIKPTIKSGVHGRTTKQVAGTLGVAHVKAVEEVALVALRELVKLKQLGLLQENIQCAETLM